MSGYLAVPSFLLFSPLLHFISLSLSFALSLWPFCFLLTSAHGRQMEAGRRRTSRFPGSPALSLLLQYQVGRVPLRTFVLTFLACFSSSSASFHLSLSLWPFCFMLSGANGRQIDSGKKKNNVSSPALLHFGLTIQSGTIVLEWETPCLWAEKRNGVKGDDRNTFSIFVLPLLVYSALFLHCSLSFSLSLSVSLPLPLSAPWFSCQAVQTEGTWKAEETKRVGSTAFLHFYDLQVRHKEKIEYNEYRNAQEVRVTSPSLPLVLRSSSQGGTMQLLHVALLLSCPSSSMSHRKFEGRREKGIEGMSWGKDNQGGIICSSSVGKLCLAFPCSWSHSSRFLFCSSSGLYLELSVFLFHQWWQRAK